MIDLDSPGGSGAEAELMSAELLQKYVSLFCYDALNLNSLQTFLDISYIQILFSGHEPLSCVLQDHTPVEFVFGTSGIQKVHSESVVNEYVIQELFCQNNFSHIFHKEM